MGEAASAQLESIRYDLANLEPSSDEARALASISSDLELFVEQAAKQREKVAANPNPNPSRTLTRWPHTTSSAAREG